MTIWFGLDTLPATPIEPPVGTLARHLGMEFVQRGADFLVVRMQVDARTRQPAGLLHGGASVALAETAMSARASFEIINERGLHARAAAVLTRTPPAMFSGTRPTPGTVSESSRSVSQP